MCCKKGKETKTKEKRQINATDRQMKKRCKQTQQKQINKLHTTNEWQKLSENTQKTEKIRKKTKTTTTNQIFKCIFIEDALEKCRVQSEMHDAKAQRIREEANCHFLVVDI